MTEQVAEPNRIGRPSLYPDTEDEAEVLCTKVIALGSEGKSQCQISAALGIPRQTLQSWAKQHSDFSAALTRAKELEQAWWEDRAQNNLTNKDFNANLWNKSMSARFRGEYGDKLSVGGDPDEPIKHEHKLDEFSSRIARLASRAAETEGAGEAQS